MHRKRLVRERKCGKVEIVIRKIELEKVPGYKMIGAGSISVRAYLCNIYLFDFEDQSTSSV